MRKKTNNQKFEKGKQNFRRGHHRRPLHIFKFTEASDRLEDLFYNHGFGEKIDWATRELFVRFYILLMNNQKKENFTRLVSIKDVAIKHFIDSMMVDKLIPLKFPLLDMGSGAGFPGIPLKIVIGPEKRIILSESVHRRVIFLKKVRKELELKDLDIIGRNIDKSFTYPVQGVITRALEKIPDTLGYVINCLEMGGCVYFMKGPNVEPEVDRALKTWSDYYKLEKYKNYSLPNTPQKRTLIVFRKIKGEQQKADG